MKKTLITIFLTTFVILSVETLIGYAADYMAIKENVMNKEDFSDAKLVCDSLHAPYLGGRKEMTTDSREIIADCGYGREVHYKFIRNKFEDYKTHEGAYGGNNEVPAEAPPISTN